MISRLYEYSFELLKPRLLPSNRIERLRQFTSNAQVVLDTILRYDPPQIPLMAPLPDRSVKVGFSEPLPHLVLQQLAGKGYRCRNIPEGGYVSDKAAE